MLNDNEEINRWLHKLDQVAIVFESKWGIGVLPTLADREIEMKWNKQKEKLALAVQDCDLPSVQKLVEGSIRAWKVLEDSAIKNGHKPRDPECWDVVHPDSGTKYRICKGLTDARAATEDGVIVYTLQEVVRVLEGHQLVNVVKDVFPGARVNKIRFEDDEIPI